MKTEYLILLAGLGVAAYLALRPKATASTGSKRAPTAGGATEITPDGAAFGWRYFSDGTAIDPYGAYYKNGQLVYNPMM